MTHLDQIALKHCACWKLLSPHLDLGNMTINDITRSLTLATELETDKRVEFFRQWKKVKGFGSHLQEAGGCTAED